MVSDNATTAFCKVEISSFKLEGRGRRTYLEAIIHMDLQEGPGSNFREFDVETNIKEVWGYLPVVTTGTRYEVKYSKETGPQLEKTAVISVGIRALSKDFNMKELEELDFDEIGEEIANGIMIMNAIHDVALQVPASEWK